MTSEELVGYCQYNENIVLHSPTHFNGTALLLVPFEAESERGFPFRACNPPTTPPTTAAAMASTNIATKNTQKALRLRPNILRSGGIGGGAPRASSMPLGGTSGVGVIGLGPGPNEDPNAESGDAGAHSETPRWVCDCFSLR